MGEPGVLHAPVVYSTTAGHLLALLHLVQLIDRCPVDPGAAVDDVSDAIGGPELVVAVSTLVDIGPIAAVDEVVTAPALTVSLTVPPLMQSLPLAPFSRSCPARPRALLREGSRSW